jgi:light-regulated signal transduction histidine kinase (bacteriophytochrome)
MGNGSEDRVESELESLRQALEAETDRRLEVQRQLDRANAEFEEFVSVAAHDLRQSLRDVTAFGQLLAEGSDGRLGSETGVCLERIQVGASKMQSLLADVVDYWATRAGGRHTSRTDMGAVLQQALLHAEKQITECGATVTHDPLPAVLGDFETLTKVLHHLIRNAIEYCVEPAARVHISARPEDSKVAFSVRDNGPGIEPEFRNRIFGVFKRLHGRDYPGSGLGLAYCKKTVEWHGGRIWVESNPGQGSIFYFELPPAD